MGSSSWNITLPNFDWKVIMNGLSKDIDNRYRSGPAPPKLLSMDCHTCRKYQEIELFLCCWLDGTQPTAYCSLECQQTDWNRHRALCSRNTRPLDRLRRECDKKVEENQHTLQLLETANKDLNRKQMDILKLNDCKYKALDTQPQFLFLSRYI